MHYLGQVLDLSSLVHVSKEESGVGHCSGGWQGWRGLIAVISASGCCSGSCFLFPRLCLDLPVQRLGGESKGVRVKTKDQCE